MSSDVDKSNEPFIAGHLYRSNRSPNIGKYVLCTEPIHASRSGVDRITEVAHRCLVSIDDGRLVASTPTFAYYDDVTQELMGNDE